MTTVLVTGCAGFIGSQLTDKLLQKGYSVVGLDCFTDYYPKSDKMYNIRDAMRNRNFRLMERDILDMHYREFPDADYVFHLAAQAGVQPSWDNFAVYARNNIEATQKPLEAYRRRSRIRRIVYASSSSVYGNATTPYKEDEIPQPVSPYGVTKLAAEHLCRLYSTEYRLPTVCLRYFTVYGPRQRPDMAIHKFLDAILHEDTITVHGSGEHKRDFTYIDDIVQATILAMDGVVTNGDSINIGGGRTISINRLVSEIGKVSQTVPKTRYVPNPPGNPYETLADTSKGATMLSWAPTIEIQEGLRRYYAWYRNRLLEQNREQETP